VASPAESQPTVAKERQAPVVVEAQQAAEAEAQPATPVAAALPAVPAVEGHPASAAAETRPEAVAATPQREITTTEARSEEAVGTQQAPALAGSSRAVVVEILDDDSPPPGWGQWVNFPTPSPESQEGVLVRRWDGHVVAGGRGHGAEASSSRARRSAPGEGRVDEPPAFADAQRSSSCGGNSVTTAPRSTER
jgi:hypothetical protein